MKLTALALSGLLAALSVTAAGCDDKDKKAAAPSATSSAASATSGGEIGIKECDDYLKAAEACGAKQPPEGKAIWEATVKGNKDTWKSGALVPETKKTLGTICKAQLDALASNPICK